MLSKPDKILFLSFLAGVALLATLSVFSFRQVKLQQESSDLINQSFTSKLAIEELISNLIYAQSQHRGFLLTRDSSFYEDYNNLKMELENAGPRIDSLILDNPRQSIHINKLDRLVTERIKSMDKVIYPAVELHSDELHSILMRGQSIMDSIRIVGSEIEKMEDLNLKERLKEKSDKDRSAALLTLFLSFVSLVGLVLSFILLRRQVYRTRRAEISSALLDRKVEERTAEIVKMNRQLRDQNEELERKNAELNSFNFISGHDMKEPLRKIEAFIKLIDAERGCLSEDSKLYFERIVDSTTRMRELIDSIVLYTNCTPDQKFEQTDLSLACEKAIKKLTAFIEEKKPTITVATLPTIRAIPGQMEILFSNLISNALKYSKPDVTLSLQITAKKLDTDGTWRIDFTDNGIGFDEKYKEKIFKIFQRLHSKDDYPGTGIGLAICKKIAENHSGVISASSMAGAGSTFSVFLPEK